MIVLVPMRMFVSEGAVISVQARHWSWHRRLASSSLFPIFLAKKVFLTDHFLRSDFSLKVHYCRKAFFTVFLTVQ
jgi:hypothetical protein